MRENHRYALSGVAAAIAAIGLSGCGSGGDTGTGATAALQEPDPITKTVGDEYTMNMTALVDKANPTDVHITLVPKAGISPALSMKQLQLKSYDTTGKLRWTMAHSDTAMTAEAGSTQP